MRYQKNSSLLKRSKIKVSVTNAMLILVVAFSFAIVSCSKNNDVSAPLLTNENGLSVSVGSTPQAIAGPGVTSGTIYNTSGLYQVDTFRQAYSTGPGQPADGNFYWRFTDNSAGSPSTTDSMDIKFTGIATGDITTWTGFGAPELKFVDAAFGDVDAGDWDTATVPENNTIGMNDVTPDAPQGVQDLANGLGWYTYVWDGHTVQPVSGRVLLWKKGSTIFKFQIQSIYKGTVFPYYTFKYQQL